MQHKPQKTSMTFIDMFTKKVQICHVQKFTQGSSIVYVKSKDMFRFQLLEFIKDWININFNI